MVRLSPTAALAVGALGVDALHAPPRPAMPRVQPHMSLARRAHLGAAAAGLAAALGTSVSAAEPRSSPWSLSTFLDAIDADQVEKVSFAADGKQVMLLRRDFEWGHLVALRCPWGQCLGEDLRSIPLCGNLLDHRQ